MLRSIILRQMVIALCASCFGALFCSRNEVCLLFLNQLFSEFMASNGRVLRSSLKQTEKQEPKSASSEVFLGKERRGQSASGLAKEPPFLKAILFFVGEFVDLHLRKKTDVVVEFLFRLTSLPPPLPSILHVVCTSGISHWLVFARW